MAQAMLGILIFGLMVFTMWIAWEQHRQMRRSGNRLPRPVVAIIILSIGAGVVFGIWLTNNV